MSGATKEWAELDAVELARARADREASGVAAAEAAPAMAREERGEIAGVPVLRCEPTDVASDMPHVFVHGGGWVFGSSTQSLGLIRRIAHQTRRPVVSVDYSLAPEHPFPRAIEEVAAVVRVLASELGVSGVSGGSAGAHIALNAVGRCADLDVPGVVLFNGAFGQTTDTWSQRAFGTSEGGATSAGMQLAYNAYAVPTDAVLPDAAILPPLFLLVGDQDPLLADTLDLYSVVAGARPETRLEVVPGEGHGFMNQWYASPRIDAAVTEAIDWLEQRNR